MSLPSYVIISPAKDEQQFIQTTIESVLLQTHRPSRWIIVDDGSIDRTSAIIRQYAATNPWIELLRIERGSIRDLGVTEICAFQAGYEKLKECDYEFIVKLDCDVELPPQYFQNLLDEFSNNPLLGIASGTYLELKGVEWVPIAMPEYHTSGASKVIKRECFESIGGFVLYRGWDTIDEIKARMRGWETRNFPDLPFRHLRSEGLALGALRTNRLHGEVYFLTGGGVVFFCLKLLHRAIFSKPYVLGAAAMLHGYLSCVLSGTKRRVNPEEAKFYRGMLNARLFGYPRKKLVRPDAGL